METMAVDTERGAICERMYASECIRDQNRMGWRTAETSLTHRKNSHVFSLYIHLRVQVRGTLGSEVAPKSWSLSKVLFALLPT